jgi:hypothetical protein
MNRSENPDVTCSRRAALHDCLFLSVITFLSLILYIQGLGFYFDDYAYLEPLASSNDQSLLGLGRALYVEEVNTRMRPLEVFFVASLYWLFGSSPVFYHWVNATLLLSGIVLFYLALRETGQSRVVAVTVPLVYGLLPHYSTDRFWMVCAPHTLSMTLYFLSLYADLRSVRHRLIWLWRWKIVSILALVGSGLSYEVALPLFVLHPLFVWHRTQQLYGRSDAQQLVRRNAAILLASNFIVLIAIVAFKAATMISLGSQTGLHGAMNNSYGSHVVFVVTEAFRVNYGTYGLALPFVVWQALQLSGNWTILIAAAMVGVIVSSYLAYVTRQGDNTTPGNATWDVCMIVGLVVFGLGYSLFLATGRIAFSSAGLDNRVAIAAAAGVALSLVGVVGRLSVLFGSRRSARRMFCFMIATLCACGFIIINTIATFWITAHRQQQIIVADIQKRFPTLAATTLILDGVCPDIGPAVVFKSHYDLSGALTMIYRDPTLRADVVTPYFRIEEEGISLRRRFYPFEENLLIYNFRRKTSYTITDGQAAQRYLQTVDGGYRCPPQAWTWIKPQVPGLVL